MSAAEILRGLESRRSKRLGASTVKRSVRAGAADRRLHGFTEADWQKIRRAATDCALEGVEDKTISTSRGRADVAPYGVTHAGHHIPRRSWP